MSAPIDVRGILERAGANPDAPEGSQPWALAQVDAAVAELVEAGDAVWRDTLGATTDGKGERLRAAIARVGETA